MHVELLLVFLTAVPEVYYVDTPLVSNVKDAREKGCGQYGARLASVSQITEAYNLGSEVCMWGYTSDQYPAPVVAIPAVAFPMQAPSPCSSGLSGVIQKEACTAGWNNCNVGAACFGLRPPRNTIGVRPWNAHAGVWSMRDAGGCDERHDVLVGGTTHSGGDSGCFSLHGSNLT